MLFRSAINFVNAPVYKEGETPLVAARPYTRYSHAQQTVQIQRFGVNNPTFASSQVVGHAAGMAADGKKESYWMAHADDKSPHWSLDTEKRLRLHRLAVQFPIPAVYRYVVEVSNDQVEWVPVWDNLQNEAAVEELNYMFPTDQPIEARFLRIRFKENREASLAEVVVEGVVCE